MNTMKMAAGRSGRRRVAARKAAANRTVAMIATLTRNANGPGPTR
jgi:hypothetical protein